ncbi:Hippurate hydrolase [Hyphodiscus hymeniophilus]|uniref:Hippurate hydrolase n=1 Tax=Hyphodiscus hymeniophilus TaxID=353542 RepID=A0A9P7AZ41_9HELO|nr:Hippurate hydrolase [Hyphodiscus hymeniophilus]
MSSKPISQLFSAASIELAPFESLYQHFHSHPELSNQEAETSATCAKYLAKLDVFKVYTKIGGHGLAGVFENGPGKKVLLRADMDALPVLEKTSLDYSSEVIGTGADGLQTHVMHACGHDMHMTCLLAAAETLVKLRDSWSGTLIVLFQPAEERGTGAKAMVDDGLYEKIPIPDYVLGQHVMAMRAGSVGFRAGTIMAGADSLRITLFGSGGHGSQPHRTVDPAVLAAHVVVRLQSIVSREVDYNDVAVLTVGTIQAGKTENIIADHATIGVDIRSVSLETRAKLLDAIRRVVKAECIASGAREEPIFEATRNLPKTVNDEAMANRLEKCFGEFFGEEFDSNIPVTTIAEDFSILGTSQGVPCAFWHWGGIEHALWDEKASQGRLQDIPMNHSSGFAPAIQPTMRTGIDTFVIATSRNPSKSPDLVKQVKDLGGIWLALDVNASSAELQAVVDAGKKKFGRIDVLVNNAAVAIIGALEDISSDQEKRSMMDTNFFGPFNLIQTLLPSMREQKSGVIVNVSSAAGLDPSPSLGMYGATKWALEGAFKTGMPDAVVVNSAPLTAAYDSSAVGQWVKVFGAKPGERSFANAAPGDVEKGCQGIFEVVTGTGRGEGKEGHLRLPLSEDCAVRTMEQSERLKGGYGAFKDIWGSTRRDDVESISFKP